MPENAPNLPDRTGLVTQAERRAKTPARMSPAPALDALKHAVVAYADRHADADCLARTPVPGLRMMRAFIPGRPLRSIYRPLICLVLQGAKSLVAGGEPRRFEAGRAVIVGVDLPVTGTVVIASEAAPYLAVAIELDLALLRQLAGATPPPGAEAPAVFGASFDADVLDCAVRLMRLVGQPEAIPVLLDPILKELHYWLLRGEHGSALAALAAPDSYQQRIARAVEVLRASFASPIRVAELAATANMSTSAFHRHFRTVTSLSPLQFQKQLRLIEARRLMLNEGSAAGHAAFAVGYQSPSQFGRDYARFFGVSPGRDKHSDY